MAAEGDPAQGDAAPGAVPTLPPEVIKRVMVEAVFWRQKYFELHQHTNQVISMLGKSASTPDQVAAMLGAPSPPAPAAAPPGSDGAGGDEWRPRLIPDIG